MEASAAMPTTVEEIFEDYRGRRSGLIKALTTGESRKLSHNQGPTCSYGYY